MLINFECQKCGTLFVCDVGIVTSPETSAKPNFEKEIICPQCGKISMNEVFLTELGLCEECAGKLELISPKEEPQRKRKKKRRGKRKKSSRKR